MIEEAVQKLIEEIDLGLDEAFQSFEEIIEGKSNDAQAAAFFTALYMKKLKAEELYAFAQAVEKNIEFVEPKVEGDILEIAGTGGDLLNAFNVLTAASFVAAGAGCNIVKHVGKREGAVSGSAELLEELGVNLNLSLPSMAKVIEQTGLGFVFEPKHLQPLEEIEKRMQLGFRTVFTVLSPLLSPIKSARKFLGAFNEESALVMAKALQLLGKERFLVAHGFAGLDDFSMVGKTLVVELKQGRLVSQEFIPEDFYLTQAKVDDVFGGTPKENAVLVKGILQGAKGAKTDMVLLNAGAAIYICGAASSIREGLEKAQDALESRAALEKLEQVVEITRSLRE